MQWAGSRVQRPPANALGVVRALPTQQLGMEGQTRRISTDPDGSYRRRSSDKALGSLPDQDPGFQRAGIRLGVRSARETVGKGSQGQKLR